MKLSNQGEDWMMLRRGEGVVSNHVEISRGLYCADGPLVVFIKVFCVGRSELPLGS